MENLNIKNSKEAQELLFNIDYGWLHDGKKYIEEYSSIYARINESGKKIMTYDANHSIGGESAYKEITIRQLRDMVVLKRNDDKTEAFDTKEMCEGGSKEKHSHYKKGVS